MFVFSASVGAFTLVTATFVPLATPVTFVLPALMPSLLITTLELVVGTVTDLNATSSLVATLMVLPFWVTAIFLPASNVMVSLGLTNSFVLPETVPSDADVVKLKPD